MNGEKVHAKVTARELARVKKRIGKTWQPSEPIPHLNTQATRDTIRHFCEGIGDMNSLYRNPKYAKKTKYGKIIAPPLFPIQCLLALCSGNNHAGSTFLAFRK